MSIKDRSKVNPVTGESEWGFTQLAPGTYLVKIAEPIEYKTHDKDGKEYKSPQLQIPIVIADDSEEKDKKGWISVFISAEKPKFADQQIADILVATKIVDKYDAQFGSYDYITLPEIFESRVLPMLQVDLPDKYMGATFGINKYKDAAGVEHENVRVVAVGTTESVKAKALKNATGGSGTAGASKGAPAAKGWD